ncbi:ATP-binding protein [Pararhodospirillum oryzae]|uniref:Anti-sigma regulatory factor n=1 Tax=Pararhodospirillum oryzae TaxID=478448 RepID=A0A512H798_9PROT|nr:ATP-binding protein [Pararhodospirillum oryzae]GEO81329.1 anti-sigma regulatory factor [Pararhodospirillum oryzae]
MTDRDQAPPASGIELRRSEDIVLARQTGRDWACRLGFRMVDQIRLATAISEIARNAVRYGGGGQCEITTTTTPLFCEISIVITDHGPGIPDVEQAMTPGFSTGNSLGMGLSGARRLVDRMTLVSRPGLTTVTLVMRRSVHP